MTKFSGFKVPTPVSGLAFEHDFKTIFDVGGNVGGWAEEAHRFWPGAAIVSFEALPDVAERNRQRAQGRWMTVAHGLADSDGPRMINRNVADPGFSTMLTPGPMRREVFAIEEEYRQEIVECYPLDYVSADFKVNEPALMRIDVEGAEFAVLKGGPNTVPRFDTVVIELNGPGVFERSPLVEEIDALMRVYGFRLVGSASELRHPEDDSLIQWDGVWIR